MYFCVHACCPGACLPAGKRKRTLHAVIDVFEGFPLFQDQCSYPPYGLNTGLLRFQRKCDMCDPPAMRQLLMPIIWRSVCSRGSVRVHSYMFYIPSVHTSSYASPFKLHLRVRISRVICIAIPVACKLNTAGQEHCNTRDHHAWQARPYTSAG